MQAREVSVEWLDPYLLLLAMIVIWMYAAD